MEKTWGILGRGQDEPRRGEWGAAVAQASGESVIGSPGLVGKWGGRGCGDLPHPQEMHIKDL